MNYFIVIIVRLPTPWAGEPCELIYQKKYIFKEGMGRSRERILSKIHTSAEPDVGPDLTTLRS